MGGDDGVPVIAEMGLARVGGRPVSGPPGRAREADGFAEGLATRLLARMPQLFEEIRAELAPGSPDFADFLADQHEDVVTAATASVRGLIAAAQRRLLGADGDVLLDDHTTELFESIGEIHARGGEELARLLAAYHVGGRIAWRGLATAALELGLPPQAIAELAEALFAFVDELTTASARGYVRAQSESLADRRRRREELAAMLLSDRCDSAALALAARRARWSLPARACVVLVDARHEPSTRQIGQLDGMVVSTTCDDLIVVIWPDRPELATRQRKQTVLRGVRAVVGRSVPLDQLPASFRVAATGVRLREESLLPDGLVFIEDHLDVVIVHGDPQPVHVLREQCLAPLDGLPAATRDRLVETLQSWLRHMGDRRSMAHELHIHPQTVRYRLAQLRELFGDTLDDPELRIRLTIALLPHGVPGRAGTGSELGRRLTS